MEDVTLLCKVVDNYGDIGFVYRLARDLCRAEPEARIRLVVSDLHSFAYMAPGIRTDCAVQRFGGMTVLDWNAAPECTEEFTRNPPRFILECFACGRPDWLDALLFDARRTEPVQVVNVEYLTAEPWADDFHLLKGGTRSALVKKLNFMPGFTPRTGGLVLDTEFMEAVSDRRRAVRRASGAIADAAQGAAVQAALEAPDTFCVVVFSYPHDFTQEVTALAQFQAQEQSRRPTFRVHVLAAGGLSQVPFRAAWEAAGKPFSVTELPALPQTAWDALLAAADFLCIRGEDSFSRACLSGVPFVWHAYAQSEEFHLVKVQAFLDRLCPFLGAEDGEAVRRFFLRYNLRNSAGLGADAAAVWEAAFGAGEPPPAGELFLCMLNAAGRLREGFTAFSRSLIANGNLTDKIRALGLPDGRRRGTLGA